MPFVGHRRGSAAGSAGTAGRVFGGARSRGEPKRQGPRPASRVCPAAPSRATGDRRRDLDGSPTTRARNLSTDTSRLLGRGSSPEFRSANDDARQPTGRGHVHSAELERPRLAANKTMKATIEGSLALAERAGAQPEGRAQIQPVQVRSTRRGVTYGMDAREPGRSPGGLGSLDGCNPRAGGDPACGEVNSDKSGLFG